MTRSKQATRILDLLGLDRERAGVLINTLIALTEVCDGPVEDNPIFPGHRAYERPALAWAKTHAGAEIDPDSEEEPDAEEDDPGEEEPDREPDFRNASHQDLQPFSPTDVDAWKTRTGRDLVQAKSVRRKR